MVLVAQDEILGALWCLVYAALGQCTSCVRVRVRTWVRVTLRVRVRVGVRVRVNVRVKEPLHSLMHHDGHNGNLWFCLLQCCFLHSAS